MKEWVTSTLMYDFSLKEYFEELTIALHHLLIPSLLANYQDDLMRSITIHVIECSITLIYFGNIVEFSKNHTHCICY